MCDAPNLGMSEPPSTWEEVRRIADEVELQIHLAGMEARERWNALRPRLIELERQLTKELHAWRKLRDDLRGE
jgi:hypothetical protein